MMGPFDFKEARYKIFPNIRDWTADHNELRYHDDPDIHEWIWFHHICFKIIIVSGPGLLALALAILAVYFKGGFGIVLGILAALLAIRTGWVINSDKFRKDYNLYDITMRDR